MPKTLGGVSMKNLLVLPAVVLAVVFAVGCNESPTELESLFTPQFAKGGNGGGPGKGGNDTAGISTTGAFTVTGTDQPIERDNKNNFWFGRAIVNGTTNFAASAASGECSLDDPSGGIVAGRLWAALVDSESKARAMRFRVFKNILGESGHGVSINSDTGKIGEDVGTVSVMVTEATASADVPANQCCVPSFLTFTGGNLRAITRWDEDGDGVLEPPEPIAALECPHLDTLEATMLEPTT
jgi:hypothetical protein